MRYLTSFMIMTLVFFAGCETYQLNREAQALYEHSHFNDAQAKLQKSLDIDYENPKTHFWMGRNYEAMGDLEKAIYEYGLAIRFDPVMEDAYLAQIDALYRNNQPDEARQVAQKLLDRQFGPSEKVIVLARTFGEMGLSEPTVMAYQRAQKIQPLSAGPTVELADYYLSVGQDESAVTALRRAFEIDPTYPGLSRRLGEQGYKVDVPIAEKMGPPRPPQPPSN